MYKPKILFVDDDADILNYFVSTFGSDYQVFLATNGIQALKIKKENDINLIFSDIKMPKMTGIEMCQEIRKSDSKTLIYSMSGWASEINQEDIKNAGFNDHIPKPFIGNQIKLAIQEAFAKLSDSE